MCVCVHLTMYSYDILSRFVKQDSCVLAISHEHAERTDIMVAHGVFLHLIKQQRGVVIAVTTAHTKQTCVRAVCTGNGVLWRETQGKQGSITVLKKGLLGEI